MSLRFPYRRQRMRRPVPSLGGRRERPQPIIPVTTIGPGGSHPWDALLDTGADDTVFPEDVAERLGIDLTNAPAGEASGVGATPVRIRYALVTLRVATSQERREWTAWVAFTTAPLKRPLLGY